LLLLLLRGVGIRTLTGTEFAESRRSADIDGWWWRGMERKHGGCAPCRRVDQPPRVGGAQSSVPVRRFYALCCL